MDTPTHTASAPHDMPPAEVDAIFERLRALKKQFGRSPNKNELAIALIGACILEGFDTRARIVGALATLGLDRSHAVLVLRENEGKDPAQHVWELDGNGHYRLHDPV